MTPENKTLSQNALILTGQNSPHIVCGITVFQRQNVKGLNQSNHQLKMCRLASIHLKGDRREKDSFLAPLRGRRVEARNASPSIKSRSGKISFSGLSVLGLASYLTSPQSDFSSIGIRIYHSQHGFINIKQTDLAHRIPTASGES